MNTLKKHAFFFIISIFFNSFISAQRDFKTLYKQTTQKKSFQPLQTPKKNNAHYVITLKNPFDYKKSFGWRMYFKGAIIRQKEGTFQFSGPKNPKTFNIIIAHIKTPNSAAIKQLEVPYGVPYKHYILQKKNDLNNQENYRWAIYETSGNKGFLIPENTLIILLDPSYIQNLENSTWHKDAQLITLPTIILTKDPQLEEASIKSVLAALDTDPFHKKLEEQSITEEYTKVSRIG